MLKSELYLLEKTIGEIVNYKETADDDQTLHEIGSRATQVSAICADLRLKWVHELFSPVKETVITRYVQYHQAGVISLSNLVAVNLPVAATPAISNILQGFFWDTIGCLEDLLKFLETGFYKYFDKDHAISFDQLRHESEQLRSLLESVVIQLGLNGVDPLLIQAFRTAIITKQETSRQSGLSYRQVAYQKSLLWLLIEKTREGDFSTSELSQLLYRQNFNSHYFQQWYSGEVLKRLEEQPKKNREQILNAEQELLRSAFVEPDRSFDPDRLPVNDLFQEWLFQQISGQQRHIVRLEAKLNGHDHMPLNFSVTQFALFVRLCYLEGCFHINNISKILRFFTSNFETKKQLNISTKSFSRAFYGADQATAAVVRDFLQRMINVIDKTYFP